MITTIGWEDGTTDVITVDSSDNTVSSDPNYGVAARVKLLSFKANGLTLATLTVTQQPSIYYNVCVDDENDFVVDVDENAIEIVIN